MSEEQQPIENQESGEKSLPENGSPGDKQTMPPVMVLAFVIIALLGMLIVIGVRSNLASGGGDSTELNEVKAELSAQLEDLNRTRMAAGLRPLEGGSEPVEDIANRMKKDADTMVAMAKSFQSMLSEKDAEISAKNSELLRSEQLRQALATESARLQQELQKALVNGSDADLLRRDLVAMKTQRDALAKELAALREEYAGKGDGVPMEEYAALQRQLEEAQRARDFFEARVKELEGQVQKAALFAKSENELLPAAVELFRTLRDLEKQPDADLMAAYSNIGEKLGANVLHTLNFATGSFALTPENQNVITSLVSEIPDGDLVFIIGYASETGNVDGNRVLSSDRATAAAELFSSVKQAGQKVQAVYLGQTDRFSGRIPERNQLVEIWRIRAK